jgi:hypothetical protein
VVIRSGINLYEGNGCGLSCAREGKLTPLHFGRAVEEHVARILAICLEIDVHVLPKRCFENDAEIGMVRELIRSNIPRATVFSVTQQW